MQFSNDLGSQQLSAEPLDDSAIYLSSSYDIFYVYVFVRRVRYADVAGSEYACRD
jgi:hypothetical protein